VFELPPLFTNVPRPTLRAASSCTDHSALGPPLALSSTGSDHDSAATPSRPLSRVYGRKAPPPLLDLALDVQQEDIPALKPVTSHFFPDNSLPSLTRHQPWPEHPLDHPAQPALARARARPPVADARGRRMPQVTQSECTLGEPVSLSSSSARAVPSSLPPTLASHTTRAHRCPNHGHAASPPRARRPVFLLPPRRRRSLARRDADFALTSARIAPKAAHSGYGGRSTRMFGWRVYARTTSVCPCCRSKVDTRRPSTTQAHPARRCQAFRTRRFHRPPSLH
jgi:hypothetical protein